MEHSGKAFGNNRLRPMKTRLTVLIKCESCKLRWNTCNTTSPKVAQFYFRPHRPTTAQWLEKSYNQKRLDMKNGRTTTRRLAYAAFVMCAFTAVSCSGNKTEDPKDV